MTTWEALPLAERHVKMLTGSGVTPAVAAARGYRTVEAEQVGLLGELVPTRFGRRSHHAGLLIPSHGVTGGIVGHQLRPDAEVIAPDGDIMKYLTPYGEASMLDCPPGLTALLRDAERPLLVTEGAKKADAAASAGWLCLALRGVDAWTSGQGTALEDWRDVVLLGRRVGICYDSDFATNTGVRGAARRLAKYLRRRGALVSFVLLPGADDGSKVGLDDWLVDHPGADPWALGVDRLPELDETDPDKTPVRATDLALADAFVARHGDNYRFVRETERWLGFTGSRWDPEGGVVLARADYQDMVRTLAPYSEKIKRDELVRVDETPWMEQSARIGATLAQAAANREMHTSVRDLDPDPYLWNTVNGTYDLRRHVFLDHDPDHLITMSSQVAYDPDAECPQFLGFLAEVLPEPETRQFVQRVFGQAMIGTVSEHIFPVFHGSGRNGKGTLLRLVQHVFGSYYSGISKSLLVVKSHDEHATVLASLHRKRLVTAQEVAETDQFNAAMIKELVGGDDITGRFMRNDEFTFAPSHTLILAANHLPKVSAKDDAFWRRLKRVPFVKVIEHPDDRVEQRMRAELPGILNWLLAGCRDYQEHGLGEPAAVMVATAGVRAEADPTARFLAEYVEVTHDPTDLVPFAELYDLYVPWLRNTREPSPMIARQKFGAEVAGALGIAPPRKRGKDNVSMFAGIRLTDGDGPAPGGGGPVGEPSGDDIETSRFALGSPSVRLGSPSVRLGSPSVRLGSPEAKIAHDEPRGEPRRTERRTEANREANPVGSASNTLRPANTNQANQANSENRGINSDLESGGKPEKVVNQVSGLPAVPRAQMMVGDLGSPGSLGSPVDIPANSPITESEVTYERLEPAEFSATATERLPDGVLAFDIESASADRLFSDGPGFVKIMGFQVGDRLGVTQDVSEMLTLLRSAKILVAHNMMTFDLLYFAVHHGLDIHQLAADGRLHDTQLCEVLIKPPPYWLEASRVPAAYKLDKLGQDKFGVGKSGDLGALVKRHGGDPRTDFHVIPPDDADYVRYCAADVDLAARLALTQRRTPRQADYMRREHRVAAIAAQITMSGVKVDTELLGERYLAGLRRKDELRERLMVDYGMPRTTKGGAPAKGLTEAGRLAIERAFNDLGVELPRAPSGKGPATGKVVMEALAEQYADRQDVLALAETVQSFNGVRTVYGSALEALHPDGRVHPMINMYQATGRWSVTHPGMTVFGKRAGRHVEREIFIADEGEVMISADLSQVDARAIAAWSQDPEYLAMFAPGMDLHAEVAYQMFGTRDRREDAKALSHGWNYGLGRSKLTDRFGPELADSFLDTMRTRFPRLVAWKLEIKEQAIKADYVLDNGWGRTLMLDPSRVHTQAAAHVGQSAARDIMMEGLLRLPRWVLPMLRVQVHDEIVLSVPEDRVDEVRGVLQDALSFPWRPFNGAQGHTVAVDILGEAGPAARSWGGVYGK